MDDLISRQAVIDAVESVDWYHQNKNGEMVHGANTDEHQAWYKAEDIYHVLDTLPSAQPVVISKLENATECEDAVSRFEVLRLIDYSSNDLNDSVDNWYFQGKVKELPSVTPKQPGWIPVTEKPIEDGQYIVTLKDDKEVWTDIAEWNPTFGGRWQAEFFDCEYRDINNVVAWQPLPTPYREGGRE